MDYIYGKLNKTVQAVTYKGLTSDTATVYVDKNTNRIKVDVFGIPVEVKAYIDVIEEEQAKLSGQVEEQIENIDRLNRKFEDMEVNYNQLIQIIDRFQQSVNIQFDGINQKLRSLTPIVQEENELIWLYHN